MLLIESNLQWVQYVELDLIFNENYYSFLELTALLPTYHTVYLCRGQRPFQPIQRLKQRRNNDTVFSKLRLDNRLTVYTDYHSTRRPLMTAATFKREWTSSFKSNPINNIFLNQNYSVSILKYITITLTAKIINEKVSYLANTRPTNAQSMAVAVAWTIAFKTSIAHFHKKEAHVDSAVNDWILSHTWPFE